jgi:hypothetical protein
MVRKRLIQQDRPIDDPRLAPGCGTGWGDHPLYWWLVSGNVKSAHAGAVESEIEVKQDGLCHRAARIVASSILESEEAEYVLPTVVVIGADPSTFVELVVGGCR